MRKSPLLLTFLVCIVLCFPTCGGERRKSSTIGHTKYKMYTLTADNKTDDNILGVAANNVCAEGDINGDGFNDILISAPFWNDCTGRVMLFYGDRNVEFSSPDVILEGENRGDLFGNHGGILTDIDNDGHDDVVIGATGQIKDPRDGRVYAFYGGPNFDTKADVVFHGESEKKGRFGLAIDAADVDKDGYVDVVIGADGYDKRRGRAYIYWGGEKMDTTADLIFEGEIFPNHETWFGRKVDASGDVNGDGYNDILVGARLAGGQSADEKGNGCAYLFLGNRKDKMDTLCDHVFRGESSGDSMGSSVELFDIDNDGHDDVIVGARYAFDYKGSIYIWYGGIGFDGKRPADVVLIGEPHSNMGGDDIICCDFNNDNYGDILVGAYNYPTYPVIDGRAYVYYGNKKALMNTDCDCILDPEEATKYFGLFVSAGDVNDDGWIDALISAPGTGIREGRVFLYFGPLTTQD